MAKKPHPPNHFFYQHHPQQPMNRSTFIVMKHTCTRAHFCIIFNHASLRTKDRGPKLPLSFSTYSISKATLLTGRASSSCCCCCCCQTYIFIKSGSFSPRTAHKPPQTRTLRAARRGDPSLHSGREGLFFQFTTCAMAQERRNAVGIGSASGGGDSR